MEGEVRGEREKKDNEREVKRREAKDKVREGEEGEGNNKIRQIQVIGIDKWQTCILNRHSQSL